MANNEQSTAVSVLERVLSHPDACPVVFVRGRRTVFGDRSLDALRTVLNELGAQNFIDLLQFPDDDAGNARIRAMLSRLISCG